MHIVESNRNSATTGKASKAAQVRMLTHRGEPLLLADWMRVLMIHFEVDAEELQRDVPYRLDLRDGHAFVSLVAFTMEYMRPRFGGRLGAWLFKPITTHDFLNVRTYVRHRDETGIHFMAEWLSNRLAVKLGPSTFGLPYRHGRISYEHTRLSGGLRGKVEDAKTGLAFEYRADLGIGLPDFSPCESGSLDEWLMERYAAFNGTRQWKEFFRVWHPPWPQHEVKVELQDLSLMRKNWRCLREAQLIGANFSPGLKNVWMGRPHHAR